MFNSVVNPLFNFADVFLPVVQFANIVLGAGYSELVLAVWAFSHRFPLSIDFGTLADGLGCFPFHDGP